MNLLDLLPAQPIPDREQMLQESLTDRFLNWMSCSFFNVSDLVRLRLIADDIQGKPPVDPLDLRISKDLDALHCVSFNALSPANRRQAIERALRFVGAGEHVFGGAGWQKIRAQLSTMCAAAHPGYAGVDEDSLEWMRNAVCERLLDLDGVFFRASTVMQLHGMLNALRVRSEVEPIDAERRDVRWSGLEALAGSSAEDWSERTRAETLRAVEGVLGLEREETAELLGRESLAKARLELEQNFRKPKVRSKKASRWWPTWLAGELLILAAVTTSVLVLIPAHPRIAQCLAGCILAFVAVAQFMMYRDRDLFRRPDAPEESTLESRLGVGDNYE